MENQNLALATMAFQKALSLDPNNVGGFKGLGNVLLRKGGRVNIGSALTYFQEAVKRDPFDDQAYAMSAKIFERLGRLKEATMERKKMVIVKTLHSDPTNHVANNNMGILMLQMEQADEAIKYFRKSIETNPDYDISHRNLAAIFYKLAISESDEKKKGDHVDQARGHVARALELGSNVTSMVINGKIMILDGRFEDALQIAEEAEVMHPANKDVYGLKRQALEKLHRTLEAQKAFDSYQTFSEEK